MSQDQSSQLDPSTKVDHPDVASTPLSLKRFIVIPRRRELNEFASVTRNTRKPL